MGKVLHRNQPCLRCKSSDAVQVYEEGPAPYRIGKLDRPYLLTGDEILFIINDLRKGD